MIVRSILFCGLLYIATLAPLFVLAVCAFIYSLFYTAYELIFLALAIDIFYGFGHVAHFVHIPYYTVMALCCVFFVEWVKPYISVYNQ